jgi:ATP-dependent Lon protease
VQGLAWTPFGGDVLYVEAVTSPGKGALQLTGSLGEVMSESARLVLSYLKSRAERFGLDTKKLAEQDLHLHFPSGSIKKDGPSAGIAIACAFVGCLLQKAAPMDLAMTGEMTVVGEVLPIGGVREKVLAAKNFGLSRVLLPKGNEAEARELKPELVAGLEILYVDRFEQVFDLVFGEVPMARAKGVRRKAAPKAPAAKSPKRRRSR